MFINLGSRHANILVLIAAHKSLDMETSATLFLLFTIVASLTWLIGRHFVRRQGRLPPGPTGLPIVGVLPFMTDKHPQLTITKWGSRYLSVYSMYVGQQLTVVLNDCEAIRAAFVEQADKFTGRPRNVIFEPFWRGGYGIITAENDFWREQRRFLLKSFRDLGVGKSRFEQLCLEEADTLVDQLLLSASKNGDQGFNPKLTVFNSVANVLTALVYGKRFPLNDSRLRAIVESQQSLNDIGQQAGALIVFPWLRFLPPMSKAWKDLLKLGKVNADVSEPEVQQIADEFSHRAEAEEPRCVVEQFLKQQREVKADNKIDTKMHQRVFHTNNILTNIETIFGAGIDTSVMTILWGMIFFLHYPEVQQKAFKEIGSKIGVDRPVNWDDRQNLPYVEAILLEIWRRGNLVPLSVQRRNIHDTHVNGFFIPKHTAIIANLWNVHRDPRYFPQPLEFRPERFIDAESGKIDRSLAVIPFSIGKRSCVGEPIARMELFLFVANMLQRIEVVSPSNCDQLPSLDEFTTGITVHPIPFKITVRRRT